MPFALSLVGAVSLAIWIYLALARGGFWRLREFDDDLAQHASLDARPEVVAVVPARNEAPTIRHCLTSLLQQNYSGEFSVVVVDDHSEDGTAEIARQTARELGREARVTVLSAPALPNSWTGKLWALNSGCQAGSSERTAPTYFWFTDADVVHAPDTLRRLVARAERGRLDLTSMMVLLHVETLPERALIPAFVFFFLKLYPPPWTADSRARTAGAAGGCILVRREALERIGSLAAIRGEVIDDCALARAVKRSGGRIWMGLTRASASLREYRSFAEIRDMIARTAFTQLCHSPLLLFATLVGLLLTYIAPLALLFSPSMATRILGACAWMLMTLVYLPTVRFYRESPLWAAVLPAAALFYSYATMLSAIRHWLGRGAQWKGRSQP